MLIMGYPQFDTQDDAGIGDGIPPIPEWQLDSTMHVDLFEIGLDIDGEVRNVFLRLRSVFQLAQTIPFPTTRLHDLTCFVVHRLLLSTPDKTPPSTITQCLRYSVILYMLIIHGPTYYSHAVILNTMVLRLIVHLQERDSISRDLDSLDVWLLGIGMVASVDTSHYDWFSKRAQSLIQSFPLADCDDALSHIKNTLWLDTIQGESLFRCHWNSAFSCSGAPKSSGVCSLSTDIHAGLPTP